MFHSSSCEFTFTQYLSGFLFAFIQRFLYTDTFPTRPLNLPQRTPGDYCQHNVQAIRQAISL